MNWFFRGRGRSRYHVGLLVMAMVLLVAVSFTPEARAASPTISLSPAGDRLILITGEGFPASEAVVVSATSQGGKGGDAVRTDSTGQFKAQLKLDDSLPWGAVSVVAASGSIEASASFDLEPLPAQSAVHATDPPAALSPTGIGGSWKIVSDDEFNGSSLDATRWTTCFHWGCDGANKSAESQRYAANNVSVGGGVARLTIHADGPSSSQPYTSGMIAANLNSSFRYGFMEMRAQLPDCAGCWPAFWAVPQSLSWPPEIDVMEGLDNSTQSVSTNFHWNAGGDKQSGPTKQTPGTDFSSGFHVFAADWEPTGISWYLDGKLVDRYSDSTTIPAVPMYVIANLAIDKGRGTPKDGGHMDIDYIRVFQRG